MNVFQQQTPIELFVVHNDPFVTFSLKHYLQLRFGKLFHISVFSAGFDAILAMDAKTEIIVLENYLEDENGLALSDSIRLKNHVVHVIRLGSNRETGDAIELFSAGFISQAEKRQNTRKLAQFILHAMAYPGVKLKKEFDTKEFLAIMIASVALIIIAVAVILSVMR